MRVTEFVAKYSVREMGRTAGVQRKVIIVVVSTLVSRTDLRGWMRGSSVRFRSPTMTDTSVCYLGCARGI